MTSNELAILEASNHVKILLNQTHRGSEILKIYEKLKTEGKNFREELRHRVAEIIIDEEYRLGNYKFV